MLREAVKTGIFVFAILVGIYLIAWAPALLSQTPRPGSKVKDVDFHDGWVLIYHESGANYAIREKAIIGLTQPQPGAGRNEILLSNGKSIGTGMTITKFEQLLINKDE